MSTAVSIVRTLLGLLFDHTIGNIVRMIPIIRLPKLERGPVSRGFLAMLLGILFFGLTMLFSASYSSAYATSGKLYSIIKPQVMIALVGLAFYPGHRPRPAPAGGRPCRPAPDTAVPAH